MATSPLATVDQFLQFGSMNELAQTEDIWTSEALADLMMTATEAIEDRCDRRLAPFSGLTWSKRASGVSNDSAPNDDVPLDLRSALGRSQAMAYGSTPLVRDFWLPEFAPVRQDRWSYSLERVELITAYGGTQILTTNLIEGPEPTTGHLRFPLGVFCPVGTTVIFTYGGGYQTAPYGLVKATIMQAAQLVMVGTEPDNMPTVAEIDSLLQRYVR